jgi:hypothetical protein
MAAYPKPTGVRVENSHGPYYEVLGLAFASPLFNTRREAEAWMAKQVARLPANRQAKQRTCLTCGSAFQSEGAHNRMCGACRASARDDTGMYSVVRGSRSGFRARGR